MIFSLSLGTLLKNKLVFDLGNIFRQVQYLRAKPEPDWTLARILDTQKKLAWGKQSNVSRQSVKVLNLYSVVINQFNVSLCFSPDPKSCRDPACEGHPESDDHWRRRQHVSTGAQPSRDAVVHDENVRARKDVRELRRNGKPTEQVRPGLDAK